MLIYIKNPLYLILSKIEKQEKTIYYYFIFIFTYFVLFLERFWLYWKKIMENVNIILWKIKFRIANKCIPL